MKYYHRKPRFPYLCSGCGIFACLLKQESDAKNAIPYYLSYFFPSQNTVRGHKKQPFYIYIIYISLKHKAAYKIETIADQSKTEMSQS